MTEDGGEIGIKSRQGKTVREREREGWRGRYKKRYIQREGERERRG